MPAISGVNFSNNSIAYNGVQFGGVQAECSSLPPEYELNATPIYDDSGRVVKFVRYNLSLSCYFYGADESSMATAMTFIRKRLKVAGKELRITGLGTGFGTIVNDVDWGPKPGPAKLVPHGNQGFYVHWSIEFAVAECEGADSQSGLRFLAINFEQTWQHQTLEAEASRTISGHVEIVQNRLARTPNITRHTADEVRDRLQILCPDGYRRITDVWQENAAKNRIEFVVVDELLPGEAAPGGVAIAEGSCDWGSRGPGFSQSTVNMAMTLKTLPGVPPALAGHIFISAAMKKQFAMQKELAPGGTVMPTAIRIANRKYDSSRVTECSMEWTLTKCMSAMLRAAGIWEPLTENNYEKWRAKAEKFIATNRGPDGLTSPAAGDVIIDACSNVSAATLGISSNRRTPGDETNLKKLECPEVDKDGGWLKYDLQLRIHRSDDQTWHKQALNYLPGSPSVGSLADATSTLIGGPQYTKSEAEADVVEYNGLPEVYVLLTFKAMRYKHPINCPNLLSVSGIPAVLTDVHTQASFSPFDLFECPLWYFHGWKLYRINGYVASVKTAGKLDSCSQIDKADKSGNVRA